MMDDAWSLLEEARKCMIINNYPGAYVNCRNAVDFLVGIMKKEFENADLEEQENWNIIYGRYENLVLSYPVLLNDRSDEPSSNLTFSRKDIEQILSRTRLLARYINELIKND